ncbi:electron transport complex subunit RsxB [Anaerotignum neopropionicum]|uniref:Electron transport complex subunit RsxB n=1 Tax=Anaerotignum neopropionicum TaxID=36847 RepID=A0A136WBD4_9FIRM|nr:ferredoxin [Anaerotignum neopropionicum]KXL51833.1 electron transport complex subunit RsxB [Anaerotignum neopropionicum]
MRKKHPSMMKIKKVWAVFFSPTGGTQKVTTTVAQMIHKALNVPYDTYDFTLPQHRENEAFFGEGDLVILGTPVIAGRVPNLLLTYFNEKLKGNGAFGVPVVSFGNRDYDDALIELRNIMEEKGFQTIAGGAFVSEHSFSRKLGAGRPDEEDVIKLTAFGEKIAEKIKCGWKYDGPAYVKGEEPIRSYFTPRDRHEHAIDIRKVKPITGEDCCGCGICAQVCPMGSISKEDPTVVSGICMKCCACVKKCPVGAKHFEDAGFIYHKEELEELYERRAEGEYFV